MKNFLYIPALIFFLTTGLSMSANSQTSGSSKAKSDSSISQQLKTADELHMSGEEQESLNVYEDVLSRDGDNLKALWNAAVLHAKMGHRQNSEKAMKRHYETAKDLADQAVKNHPDSGYAYYAKAVSEGRMSEVLGAGGKVDASRKVKENIEKAAERIPDFAPVWHLYGVWHSDVANMSGAVKAAAGLFSGGIPDASNQKAEEYLSKAISLDEDNILFHLDFAKHYLKVDKPEKAKPLLEKILTIEPQMKDDPKYIDEAKEMLNDIES